MCKLYVITGRLNRQTQAKAVVAINSKYRFGQRDGYGFVSVGSGPEDLAWCRYADPEKFYGIGQDSLLPPFLQSESSEVGKLPATSTVLIAHGRTSTNRVCLGNVHPFRDTVETGEKAGDYFLAHNGVVHWKGNGPAPDTPHGCDSEQYLRWLTRGTGAWHDAVSHWGGFGAVVLTNSQDGVTVIGQDNAQLFCSRRARGEGWIFATRPEDLVDVAKEAGISLATCPIKVPTRLMFFDRTGIMFHDEEWLGFGTNTGQTYNRQYDRAYGTETGHANGNGNGKGEAGFFAGGASGASQPPTPRSDSDSPKADSAQGNCESSKVGCERTPNSSGLITTGAQPSDYRPKATTAQVLGVNHTPPTAEETLEAQVREHFGYID